MKRFWIAVVLLGALAAELGASCAYAQSRFGLQDNTDRFGADYAAVDVTDVIACRARCQAEGRCAAFTFLKPLVTGQPSRCWLKQAAPAPSDNNCCISGARDVVADLSIVTVNAAGTSEPANGDGSRWPVRYERLALQISRSGTPPDLISLTELYGWTWCHAPVWQRAGDYEALDVLIDGLARRTDVIYRVAYMIGRLGGHGGINRERCQYLFGDAVLYHPERLINRTPADRFIAPSWPLIAHDDATADGVQMRRSLPICNPAAHKRVTASLIDGALQTEKCNQATPSGPAWALTLRGNDFNQVTTSLARFAFVHDQRASFDVFTIHPANSVFDTPNNPEQPIVIGYMRDFIEGLSKAPFRTQPAMLPALVVGDKNGLPIGWLPSVTEVFAPGFDVMTVMQGAPAGSAPPRVTPTVSRATVLPLGAAVRGGSPAELFSDHIALRVDFMDPTAPLPPTPPPRPHCSADCAAASATCLHQARTPLDHKECIREKNECNQSCLP